MKKKLFLFACSVFFNTLGFSQKVYDDFEAPGHIRYAYSSGVWNGAVNNPDTSLLSANKSKKCGQYERKATLAYDNIRMITDSTFDIRPYIDISSGAPHFTMKIRTNDNTSRKVQLQVGRKIGTDLQDTSYNNSIYALFDASTSALGANKWETLTFKYTTVNKAFDTTKYSPGAMNKILFLFSPNDIANIANDTIWVDDLSGPAFAGVVSAGVNEARSLNVSAVKIFPNPAKESLTLNFQNKINTTVKIEFADMLGRKVLDVPEEKVSEGAYSKTLPLQGLSTGLYYLSIKTGTEVRTEKVFIK